MKRLIPIAILVLVLTTGCLRKPEHYESMRNTEIAEPVEQESTEQKKPEDSNQNNQQKSLLKKIRILTNRQNLLKKL